MNLKVLLCTYLLTAVSALAVERPNILFLITDQQMADALSCAGNPYVKTPNLDRLAARGMRFTKSYVANPLCVPSRASLFSSRMPHELGVYGNTIDAQLRDKGVPTLGELMQSGGYETAYAGKWHVHDAFPAYTKKTIPGFELLPMSGGKDPRKGDKKTERKSTQCDPYVTEAAVNFLKQSHEKPFLLTVSLLNPHDICEFQHFEGFQKMLPKEESKLPPLRPNFRDSEKLPTSLKSEKETRGAWSYGRWSDLQWRQYQWMYYRLVEESDARIGKVLEALESSGLSEKTLVVFTSDHGEMLGSHRKISKELMYEESVSVPLIIAAPGHSGVVDRSHLVVGMDLMPTFLDYAGVAIPETLRGLSLRPVLEGKSGVLRDYVAAESFDPEARMIRTERYKYIRFTHGENTEQFFDLETDPGELKNLIEHPDLAPEVERHRRFLADWMKRTNDEFGKGSAELAKIKSKEDEQPKGKK